VETHGVARFDPADLKRIAGDAAFARCEACVREGRVALLSDDGDEVEASVAGTTVYRTTLRRTAAGPAGDCTCPAFAEAGFCKHLVATALAAEAGGEVPDRLSAIRAHLRAQTVDQLVALILDLAERDENLLQRLDLAASAAGGDAGDVAERCRAAPR
jgi:uncharacterized Zn finger protein